MASALGSNLTALQEGFGTALLLGKLHLQKCSQTLDMQLACLVNGIWVMQRGVIQRTKGLMSGMEFLIPLIRPFGLIAIVFKKMRALSLRA